MRTGLTLAINNDYQDLADRQSELEAKAQQLAAAWTDFDMVENIAAEVVRRFGSIDPRDFGVLRLHREPVFVAFQTAAVSGYVRPFIQGGGLDRIAEKYSSYDKPEWMKLHDELLFWHYRLSGENSARERQFIVAPDDTRSSKSFVVGEATAIL